MLKVMRRNLWDCMVKSALSFESVKCAFARAKIARGHSSFKMTTVFRWSLIARCQGQWLVGSHCIKGMENEGRSPSHHSLYRLIILLYHFCWVNKDNFSVRSRVGVRQTGDLPHQRWPPHSYTIAISTNCKCISTTQIGVILWTSITELLHNNCD